MRAKETYTNGQIIKEIKNNILTYFYKNGKVKAKGIFENNKMEGEWIFYRETGQLWQIANFKNNMKHGHWIRYDREGKVEYNESFDENKIIKNKK